MYGYLTVVFSLVSIPVSLLSVSSPMRLPSGCWMWPSRWPAVVRRLCWPCCTPLTATPMTTLSSSSAVMTPAPSLGLARNTSSRLVSVCTSVCLSVCNCSVYVCLSVCLSVCNCSVYVCLSVCLSVTVLSMSVCLSVTVLSMSVCLSVTVLLSMSVYFQQVGLCLYVCLSVCMSETVLLSMSV